MMRQPTLFRTLRRERLPFALIAMLVLVLQLLGAGSGMAMPQTGDGAVQGQILCLGSVAFGLEAEGGESPREHHGDGFCPCGPVCPHGPALTVVPPAAGAGVPVAARTAVRQAWAPTAERGGACDATRSPGIRAPPHLV
ncbi:hypothetical protein GCM10007285_20260 [Stappia taiwanensis]|nr:hypothetical protein GCM10007285_20260 [Stappia taiwanensis]